MKNNKYLSYALGILFSFCLIVTLLITSVEAVTYWTPGYYEREIAHMEDVRGLFVGALVLRRICIITAFVCVALLWLLKADIALVVPRSVCWGTGLFLP